MIVIDKGRESSGINNMVRLSTLVPTNRDSERETFLNALHEGRVYNPKFVYEKAKVARDFRKRYDEQLSFEYFERALHLLEQLSEDYKDERDYHEKVWGDKLEYDEANDMINKYVAENAKLEQAITVKWCMDSFVTNCSGSTVTFIKRKGYYRRQRLISLLDHEIGTHFTRTHNMNQIAPNRQKNSCKRRVKFPRVGWLLSTEEGLACLNTFKSYSDKRLFGSALLYYACCLSSKLSFYELWKKLDVYLKGDEERLWIVCMRVKRGVEDTSKPLGFYKDQATFSGAVRLLALRRSINFRHLHLCKCSVEELPAVKPFLSQIINSGNGLLPWFVETDDEYSKYMTQLDEIAKANNIGVHESSKNFRCRRIPTWAFAGSKVKAK